MAVEDVHAVLKRFEVDGGPQAAELGGRLVVLFLGHLAAVG
ncbi:hypothetical protein AB0D83_35075 [Streptomyces decoyicus]